LRLARVGGVDDAAADDRRQHRDVADRARCDGLRVIAEDDEVGKLAGLDAANRV